MTVLKPELHSLHAHVFLYTLTPTSFSLARTPTAGYDSPPADFREGRKQQREAETYMRLFNLASIAYQIISAVWLHCKTSCIKSNHLHFIPP